jgi:phospholipid/cholesterol/gamma-HCH transport system permease protein
MAYLFASQADKVGATIFVVDAVSIGICRELSPVLTAIIVAGRSGSAFTAQLGTMKMSQEIDAIRVMGLSPLQVLVLPRIFALTLAMPLLVFAGDVFGILGGFFISNTSLEISWVTFTSRLQGALQLRHVYIGLAKAPIFAIVVALISCRLGLTVEDNARSVGINTTATVVQSVVTVILLDAMFAIILQNMGW